MAARVLQSFSIAALAASAFAAPTNNTVVGVPGNSTVGEAPGVNSTASAGGAGQAGYDANSTTAVSNANCRRETYSINVTSSNTVFQQVSSTANQTYFTSLVYDFVTGQANFTKKYEQAQKKNVSGTYQISGVLCTPKQGRKDNGTVQLLVHGIGFDASYWNFVPSGNANYSYAYQAAAAGYTTFRYDRLGTGLSEHPADTYNVVQAPTDLAILKEVSRRLRAGQIGGQKFNKIIGVGHSYGSVQLQATTANTPSAVDAVILTGFSANSTGLPLYFSAASYSIATNVFPERFQNGSIAPGYLATVSPQSSAYAFLYFPYYTEQAAQLARQTEQPVTQGVLFTQGSLPKPAPSFKGPVHVVTGQNDFIFTLGNAYAVPAGSGLTSIPEGVKALYPAASKFQVTIPPNTGHGISAHLSAPEIYSGIQKYIATI